MKHDAAHKRPSSEFEIDKNEIGAPGTTTVVVGVMYEMMVVESSDASPAAEVSVSLILVVEGTDDIGPWVVGSSEGRRNASSGFTGVGCKWSGFRPFICRKVRIPVAILASGPILSSICPVQISAQYLAST